MDLQLRGAGQLWAVSLLLFSVEIPHHQLVQQAEVTCSWNNSLSFGTSYRLSALNISQAMLSMYLPLVQRSRCVPINSLSTTDVLEGRGHPRPSLGMMCPVFPNRLSSAAGALHKPPAITKLPGWALLIKSFSHLSFSIISAC